MPEVEPAALICKPVASGIEPTVPPNRVTWIFGATTGTTPPVGSVSVTLTVPKPEQVVTVGKLVWQGLELTSRLMGFVPLGRTGVVVKTPGFVPAAEGLSPVVLVPGPGAAK